VATTADISEKTAVKKRVLVFTDSRGQHKPAGQDHATFGERLAVDPRFEVALFLCPMKWTTTLDFLDLFGAAELASFDHVVLYTGIVEWSPRRRSSAIFDLYDNPVVANAENISANTRDYSKKVVNNKKKIFDSVFGEDAMAQHFQGSLGIEYEGEVTSNMYSLQMAETSLIKRLNDIPNLIFVSANRFVPGWQGDYRRERPNNISLSHAYSDAFCQGLSNVSVIDLGRWTDDEVMVYTCDNLHLTRLGTDFIFDELMKVMGVNTENQGLPATVMCQPASCFTGSQTPERIDATKKKALLAQAKRRRNLATLVIGVRLDPGSPTRDNNLNFLLSWIEYFYGDLFDVLLVEQDTTPRISLALLQAGPCVRHEFIFNPKEYNRGWGYNTAIANFCADADVVVLMDTDVLTGRNFVREVVDCHIKYDAISPYQNIYYTTQAEGGDIRRTFNLELLADPRNVKNPVTVAGGILVIRKEVFLQLKGFEQYIGYGCEDRAFDVTLYNHLEHSRIRIAPDTYAHLWHPTDVGARTRFKDIYKHLVEHYGCKHEPGLGPFDFIHQRCQHVLPSATKMLMDDRASSFGDIRLYRYGYDLAVNGTLPQITMTMKLPARNVVYPPDFTSLTEYAERELYAGSPEPDTKDMEKLYNAFKGKRCFIIGNGPSLNKNDLSLLKNEYSFGVNSFYYKTRETGFRPYFYVVEDSSVMKENIDEIKRYEAPYKFFPTNYRSIHPKEDNTIFFRMNRGFYEKSSPNYAVPRFSTDASKVLYCGQSVTYINLQLAYFMGFSEIYLIGMDFSYVIPDSHKRTGDVLLSDTDDPNHFHKDYFGKGKSWKDPKLDRVALNYRLAKLVYESTGRAIYNATVGGSLEIFERIDYAALFRPEVELGAAEAASALAAANALYRERRFAEALTAYVGLASIPSALSFYKRSAVTSYMLAKESGQSCRPSDVDFVCGLMSNF